jgi:hypothetical protein
MKYFAYVLLAGISALVSCAPRASSVPLGVGPLAAAERDSQNAVSATRALESASAEKKQAPAPAAAPVARVGSSEDEDEKASKPSKDVADSDEATTGKPKEGEEAPDFAGLYAGTDVAIYRRPGFPDQEQLDDKAKIRIEKDSDSAVRIALVNSDDGSDLCELKAQVQGNAAVLAANQPCFSSEGEGGIKGEITSGRAVLDGDELTLDAEGTLTETIADQEVEGELSYSFTGQRH